MCTYIYIYIYIYVHAGRCSNPLPRAGAPAAAKRGGVSLTEILLPRVARRGTGCVNSARGSARKTRTDKCELDEGFQPHHPPFRVAPMGTAVLFATGLLHVSECWYDGQITCTRTHHQAPGGDGQVSQRRVRSVSRNFIVFVWAETLAH